MNEGSQVLFDDPIHHLRLAIDLGMVHGAHVKLGAA